MRSSEQEMKKSNSDRIDYVVLMVGGESGPDENEEVEQTPSFTVFSQQSPVENYQHPYLPSPLLRAWAQSGPELESFLLVQNLTECLIAFNDQMKADMLLMIDLTVIDNHVILFLMNTLVQSHQTYIPTYITRFGLSHPHTLTVGGGGVWGGEERRRDGGQH